MHISQVLSDRDPDHEDVRALVDYAQSVLGFTGDIDDRTDVAARASEYAAWAARDQVEISGVRPSDMVVEKAEMELFRHGQDHQQDLPYIPFNDCQEERAASYGEWRNEQREAERDMERSR